VAEQSEREILQDILSGVEEMMAETRKSRQELYGVKKELTDSYQNGKVTELGYRIRLEQVDRSYQTIVFCIRRLEQQKKIALQKLQELG
jgi:hypothetical protein